MLDALKQQYEWIKSNRNVVFSFLEGIPLEKLHESLPGFGIDSIMKSYFHTANSYRYWIGSFAFKEKPSDFKDTSEDDVIQADIAKVREIFQKVDEIVQRFFVEYQNQWFDTIENEVEWSDKPMKSTPLFLLTNVETHEFHHRGQIIAMARHLGYTSSDARLGSLFY